jgi:hypothetical protein
MGRIATPSGTVAFAATPVVGEAFMLRGDLVVPSGSVAGLEGSIAMHDAPIDRPLLVERYFDDKGAVTAARVGLADRYDEALEAAGEWEEAGVLSLMLGQCMACDPRRKGELHRLPFSVRTGRYTVDRLVIADPVEPDGYSVGALRIRIQGQRKPSSRRRS